MLNKVGTIKRNVDGYQLIKDTEVLFVGSNDECYYKLQQMQSQSASWAMKYEGWSITATGTFVENPRVVVESVKNYTGYSIVELDGVLHMVDHRNCAPIPMAVGDEVIVNKNSLQMPSWLEGREKSQYAPETIYLAMNAPK